MVFQRGLARARVEQANLAMIAVLALAIVEQDSVLTVAPLKKRLNVLAVVVPNSRINIERWAQI